VVGRAYDRSRSPARAALFCTECEREKERAAVTGVWGSAAGYWPQPCQRRSRPQIPGAPVPAVSALGRGQHLACSISRTVDIDDVPLLGASQGKEAKAVAVPLPRRDGRAEPLREGPIISGYPQTNPPSRPPPWRRVAGHAITTADKDPIRCQQPRSCAALPDRHRRACVHFDTTRH